MVFTLSLTLLMDYHKGQCLSDSEATLEFWGGLGTTKNENKKPRKP